MNKILFLILVILLFIVGGKKGIKLLFSLVINFILLLLTFILIARGFDAIIISIISSILICYITIYLLNGDNIKSKVSFISTILVLLILFILIYVVTILTKSYGFGYEAYEEINMFSYNINLDMSKVEIGVIILGLLGALIDSSISISSALYEIKINNNLKEKELLKSGLNIGSDILNTTINTLLFAFFGEALTLFLFYKSGNYTFIDIINNKTFVGEVIKILFSMIGCLTVIPLTSLIATKLYIKEKLNGEV